VTPYENARKALNGALIAISSQSRNTVFKPKLPETATIHKQDNLDAEPISIEA
jgi:hypothetical protein